MASAEPVGPPRLAPPARRRHGRRSAPRSWRLRDQIVFVVAWSAGIALCIVLLAVIAFFAVQGIEYLRPSLLVTHPSPSVNQAGSGGFLDAIEGTVLLGAIGLLIAVPIGVVTAVWVIEFGRPRWLGRVVESTVEIIAGTPDIVIAIFGLALFQLGFFSFLSLSEPGGAFGRSFLTAGAMMSFLAIPPIYTATRNGLIATPRQMREASYALGKTRIATIRRVVLPAIRRDIATGSTLGLARIIGDTAIVILLLGATLRLQSEGAFGFLSGTGSSLTSYIYNNSPAGDGNAPQKAYAAAAVLLLLVVGLNWAVGRVGRIGGPPLHQPSRRLGA
jgi:phosphate transport system permease protein